MSIDIREIKAIQRGVKWANQSEGICEKNVKRFLWFWKFHGNHDFKVLLHDKLNWFQNIQLLLRCRKCSKLVKTTISVTEESLKAVD